MTIPIIALSRGKNYRKSDFNVRKVSDTTRPTMTATDDPINVNHVYEME